MDVHEDLPVPDEATQHYYEEHAQSTFERMQAVQPGGEHYAPFLALIPAGGQILDAGCGSGRDSRFFIQKGYGVTAMDGAAALGRLAAESLGQAVLHLTFEE